MTGGEHDRTLLGAYALGVLDADDIRAVDEHVATCADCRRELTELSALNEMLGDVPPEAFLEGPPPGGDLLLQRTLRAVRSERSRTGRQRTILVAAAVVGLLVLALGGGVLIGRQRVSTVETQARPSPTVVVSGFRSASATDATTGTAMTVGLTPAIGWVRVHATVEHVKAGEKCQLVVRTRDGSSVVAGSWLVSAKGEQDGTTLDGSALVPADQVASVDVVTLDGRRLVSVTV